MGAHRRRSYGGQPKRPEPAQKATGHTFLIVVEGEATEIAYLEAVRTRLKRRAAAVLVYHGKHTDPEGVVREAIKLRDKQAAKPNGEPYDQVWAVFDREKQNDPRLKQVPAAIEMARANGIKVALSVPSIEFWLFLHFDFTTKAFDGCAAIKKALKKFIKDYEKSDLPLDELLNRVTTAMKHAAKCHEHWERSGGDRNPSTQVNELMRALSESARNDERFY